MTLAAFTALEPILHLSEQIMLGALPLETKRREPWHPEKGPAVIDLFCLGRLYVLGRAMPDDFLNQLHG